MMTAPVTLRADNAAIITKPRMQTIGSKLQMSPSPTSVPGLATTMPAFLSAMKPRNKPMPAAMPSFRLRGIALISHSRIGSTLIATNSTPETNTAPSAVCQLWPMPSTTPKVKNAFCPMPGACAIG